jgi:7-cyano-7-deazaguanine synthase
MSSHIVLLSGGLDSTVNLFAAAANGTVKLALTFDYGQRAAESEIRQARILCEHLDIDHHVVELRWLQQITRTSLVNRSAVVPTGDDVSIHNLEKSQASAKAVWVPNRNGVMLNIAASFAESLNADYVVPGFNKEEAVTFPDNTPEFMQALDASFSFSTASHVRVKCFTENLNKTEIVRLGFELGVPFELVWPCYFNGNELCGQCESCKRYSNAFAQLNLSTSSREAFRTPEVAE